MKLLSTIPLLFIVQIFWFNPAFSSGNNKSRAVKGPNGEVLKEITIKHYVDPAIRQSQANRYAAFDTLFWDDFEADTFINDFNRGGPWFNYDLDGNTVNGGLPMDYFVWPNEPIYSMVNGDTLYFTNVAVSYSWTVPEDSNFNDLVTGFGIPITKPGSYLTYTAWPQQGPQWNEGYTLKIDTVGGLPDEPGDTLIFHKEHFVGDGPLWDPSYVWWPSHGDTIFAEFYYDATMVSKADSGNAWVGPTYYNFSLDAYVGHTIYIHWYHNSYWDVAVWFDDIGVFEPQTVGMEAKEKFYLNAFPNPASDILNVEYSGLKGNSSNLQLYNSNGELVKSVSRIGISSSMGRQKLNISGLSPGIYLLKMEIDGKHNSKKIIIR